MLPYFVAASDDVKRVINEDRLMEGGDGFGDYVKATATSSH